MRKLLLYILYLPIICLGQDCEFCPDIKLPPGLYSDESNGCKKLSLPITFENHYMENKPFKNTRKNTQLIKYNGKYCL